MKTAKLIIDGKEIEVQLTDEQAQELTVPKKVTGFERDKDDKFYFLADSNGIFFEDCEANASTDDRRYQNANYYSDISLAEWCICNDTLNRKMRRWAAEHNTSIMSWGEKTLARWCIIYDFKLQKIIVKSLVREFYPFAIYFSTSEIAEAAIEEFGDEIKWLAENRPKWF